MRRTASRLRAARENESGVALLVVIGIGMLLLAIVATGLTVAISGLKKTDNDQDWNGALDAAYAGVEEYQSRLATDNSYYTYGNPAAPFSILTNTKNLTLPTGTSANPAFGVDAGGTWATVPGSSPIASFRYEVDSSTYAKDGRIRIRSTGKVGNVTRSIVADLKQSGFIDYLYFTDFEIQDPDVTGESGCDTLHGWENRGSNCDPISFAKSDSISGPVHSNDIIHICGSTFKSKVTSSYPTKPYYANDCTGTTINFSVPPAYQPVIQIPTTNGEMRKETRNDLPNEVPLPGCLYTGPTEITFTSDGKMNVKSPWTLFTNIGTTKSNSTNPAACGTPGENGLGSTAGQTIDVLPPNLIFVQNVPVLSTDPNYPSATPKDFTCVTGTNPGWTFGTSKYPAANETTPANYGGSTTPYGCKNGDLFVKGTFKGAMTAAAENFIYITGDLTYNDDSKDILGLVGQNAVWVWNPMSKSNNTYTPLLGNNRTIEAAIISVKHTFQVQNYTLGGTRGNLNVYGSIAQKFRGTVGTSSGGTINNGYVKKYEYDTRLAYTAPPKFLSPVSSSYGVTQYAGVPAAFLATGAPVK